MASRHDGAIRLRLGSFMPLLAVALVAGGIGAAPSRAASAGPHWSILSESQPTFFKLGDSSDAYVLIVRNDGGAPTTHGSTVAVTDTLPSGVTATKVTTHGEGANGDASPRYEMTCPTGPLVGTFTCTYSEGPGQGRVLAGTTIVMTITVSIPAEIKEELGADSATVSGGGAPSASTSETTPINGAAVPFGLSFFDINPVTESGEVDTEAGSHPFELTTSLAFNVSARESPSVGNGHAESPLASASPKDIEVALPSGMIGNPNAIPQCRQQAFLEREGLNCPLDTQVGTVKPAFYGAFKSSVFPVFNVVPPPGQPGELGFSVANIGHVPIFFHVRSNGDYGLTAQLDNIPETGPLQGAILTLWGVPAAPSHDLEREGTLGEGAQGGGFCQPLVTVEGGVEKATSCPSGAAATPFLTMPSSCPTKLPVRIRTDSWQNPEPSSPLEPEPPGRFLTELNGNKLHLLATTGCEQLSFTPSLALAPETTQAGAPSGYTIDVHVPQNEDPTALATPDLRRAVVSLPAGAVISPSVANGLQGCSPEQFGLRSLASASCPPQSQIGTVKITTPLLSSPLEGQVFVGQPECAPCTPSDAQQGRLIRLLLQAQGSGVTVKLEGATSIDQSTGQLTATFDEAPQLPFEDLKLTLDGGQNAPLANPSTCGVPLTAASQLTPYSSEQPATPSSEPFEVTGCASPRFQPSFVAGTTNNQAGAFSPLTVTLSRTDQDEDLSGVTVHLAPGLLGMLSKVALCAEAQARAGACGPQSEIGSATVGAGPGASPLFLDGHVYLTGPYEGAPFGLSIVVPAVAGPLNVGTIDVGARIEVNPRTAALTIASDPLPQSLDGIPLQIKTINLDVDRQGFVFNPTNCQPREIEGALTSSAGATAPVSSRFQAANCATLAFKPRLSGLAHAKTSKADGAYLHMRLESAPGQANIASVKVDVPKQLPVRLTTLQKACAAAVLEANPAGCPAASVVGSVTVITPVLRHALVGPAYLVSHGGAHTPDLEFVLQGEGVTIDVVGQTIIKHGVISGVFRSLPDVPISTLGLVLNVGPHSLLTANLPAKAKRSLCGQSLAMSIALTGQNGAVVKQTKKITVSGCPKRKAHGKAKRKPQRGAKRKA
ncbi:MAG: hypothetical protein ABSB69_02600 [Solirubrobacteraceae bacterium]